MMSCRHSVASSAGSGTCDTNNNMLSADNLLRLALKKPKDWKWELTTSSSSPNISFPKIQLFDSTSGELMVEVDRADCVIRSDCSDGRGASKHHATLSVEQSDLLQSSSSSREQDSQRPGRYRRARTSLVKERLSTSGDSLADIFNQLQNKGLGHKLSTSGSQYRLLNGAAEEARGSLQKSKSANAIISPEPELVTRRKSRRSVASRSSSILERISEFYGHSSTDDEELSSDQRLPVVPVPVPQLSLPSGGDPPAKEQWESSGVTIEEIPSTAPIKPRPKIYKLVRSNVGTLMVREESFHTQNSLRRRPPANNERETPETMGPGFERIVQLEDHPDEGPEPPKGRSRYEQEINRIDGLLSRVMLSHDLQTEELKRNTPSIHVSEPPPEDTRHLSTGTNGVTHLSNGTNPRRRRSRRSASVGASVFPGTQNGVRATSSSSNSEETTTRRRKSRSSSQKRRGRSRHRGNTHEDTHATISNGDQLITHTGEPDRQWQPAAGPERSDSSSQVATKPTQQYSSGSSSATTNDGAVDLAEPSSVTATGVCEVTGLSEVRLLASASQEPVTQRRNRKSNPNQAVVSTTVTVSSFLAESYNASDKVLQKLVQSLGRTLHTRRRNRLEEKRKGGSSWLRRVPGCCSGSGKSVSPPARDTSLERRSITSDNQKDTFPNVSESIPDRGLSRSQVYYAPQLDDRLLSLEDLELLELEPEVELTIERTDRYEYGDTASDDHDDEHTEDDDEVSGTAGDRYIKPSERTRVLLRSASVRTERTRTNMGANVSSSARQHAKGLTNGRRAQSIDNLKSDTTQYFHQYHNNNNGDTFHHQTFLVDGPLESGDGAGRGEKQPPPPDLACLPGPGQVLHQQQHPEHAVYVSQQDRNKFCGSLPNHLDLDVSAIGDRDCEAIVNRQNEFLQANLKNVQQHQKQTVIHLGQTNAHDLQLTFAGTGHFLPQLAPYQQIAPVEPGSTFRSANAPEPTSQSQHHHPAPALASIQQKLLLHRTVVDAGCDQGYGSERSPEDELPPPLLLLHDRQYLKMLPSSNSSIGLAPDGPSVETSGTSSAPGSSDTSAGGGDGFAQPQKCWATLNATGQLAGGPYSFITKDTIFSVQVSKSTRGLGLSVSGGSDSNAPFAGLIRIKRLFPHQAAWATGMLQPGDIILEANGVPLTGLTNYHALEILRQTTSVVTLTVCRPKDKQYRKLSPPTEPPKPPLRNALSNEPGLGSGSVPPSPVPTGIAFQQQQQQQHHQLMQHFFPTSSIGYEPPFLPPLDPLQIGFNGEFEIVLTKQQGSLGFTLRKEDESILGHYVRALVREPALSDGRIRPGDKIVAVNDVPISTMTHEEAVIFLRQAADVVHLRLYRDQAQTPISAQSPTDSSCSGQRKVRLRPEALNLLTDLAASRSHQVAVGSGSQVALSNMSTPRRLRRVGAHHSGLDRLGFQEQQQDSNDIFNYFDICSNASTIVSQADNFDEAYYFDDEIDALIADEGNFFTVPSNEEPRPRPTFLNLDAGCKSRNQLPGPTGTTVQQLNKDGGQHGEEASAFVSLPCETLLVACKTEQNLHSTNQTEAIYVQHFAHKSPLYSSLNVPATAQPDELAEAVVRGGKISLMKWKGKMLQMAAGEEEDKVSEATRSLEHPPLPTPEGNGFSLSATEERDLAPSEGVLDLTAHMGVDIDGNKLFFVELNKGWNSRLGFSLKQQECPDGKNRTIISAIYRDSVAARNGRLHVGDVLLTVNEESVESLPTAQVIELLRIVRGPIFITLMRPRVPSNDILEPTPAEPKEIDELDADAAKALSTLQIALYPEDGAAPEAAVEGTEDAKKDCE